MTLDLSLYVVVDPQFTGGRAVTTVACAALRGGAAVLQLRDKGPSVNKEGDWGTKA